MQARELVKRPIQAVYRQLVKVSPLYIYRKVVARIASSIQEHLQGAVWQAQEHLQAALRQHQQQVQDALWQDMVGNMQATETLLLSVLRSLPGQGRSGAMQDDKLRILLVRRSTATPAVMEQLARNFTDCPRLKVLLDGEGTGWPMEVLQPLTAMGCRFWRVGEDGALEPSATPAADASLYLAARELD